MTLSQRLKDELIGEPAHPFWCLVRKNQFPQDKCSCGETVRIDRQRQALKPTIATIEADLKGLVELNIIHHPDCADNYRPAEACDCFVKDLYAAIERYTRDKA